MNRFKNKKKLFLYILACTLLIACNDSGILFNHIMEDLSVSNLEIQKVELLKDYMTTDFNLDDYQMMIDDVKLLKVLEDPVDISEATDYHDSRVFFLTINDEKISQMELCLFYDGYIRITTYDQEKMPETMDLYKIIETDREKLIAIIENF